MLIQILPENCIACGLCHTYNPIFDYNDEGLVQFATAADTLELALPFAENESLTTAVKTCPTHAILVKSD
ncbi:ferredoxin [Lactococcus insecticola]|uniref:Ferredoxin n=1 Tax=Pseudolactococcus insecticola TaxID=2709158 RepID=A0A6A0B567_9LACT|nr:ferredoxin [Lactococcus insecticola]GFH40156.1 ferredoxin [Lactococcus insecticola]